MVTSATLGLEIRFQEHEPFGYAQGDGKLSQDRPSST